MRRHGTGAPIAWLIITHIVALAIYFKLVEWLVAAVFVSYYCLYIIAEIQLWRHKP